MTPLHRTTPPARHRRGLKTAVVGLGLLSLLGVAGISAAAENDPTPTASTTDLEALRDTVVDKLEAADLKDVRGYGAFLDPDNNRVLLHVATDADPAALRTQVEALTGKSATLTIVKGTLTSQVDHFGGQNLEPGCTAGFAVVVDNANGGEDDGFLTAGHCFDGRKRGLDHRFSMNGKTMQGHEFSYSGANNNTDYGILTKNNTDDRTMGEIADGTSQNPFAFSRVKGFQDPQVGLKICKMGRTTGKTCGTIFGVEGTIFYPATVREENGVNVVIHNAAKVEHVVLSNLCTEAGDSGSPVYSQFDNAGGVSAVAIHSGGVTDAQGRCMEKSGGSNIAYHSAMSTDPAKSHIPVHSTNPFDRVTLKVAS